ncbi:MAG: outer membrane protein assembly factor BamA [Treponema sp.]|nr:outer membrane protein assembly factor BamA [Treponema sp.]
MRNKHGVLLLISAVFFAALISLPVFSQSSDGWYYDKVIRSVSFEGLQNVKASDLEGITAGYVGKRFSDAVIEDIYNRTYSLDYFQDITDIRVTPGDGTQETCNTIDITLVVVESPVIVRIKFTGYRQVRLADLKDAVSSKEKGIYNDGTRYMDERAIRDLYIDKGYTDIKVSSSVEELKDGFMITFMIDEGQQTVVKEISFTGNSSVSANTLKGKLSLKEIGLFQKGTFKESQLEQDVKTITSYYTDRGYVDAKVLNYTVDSEYNEEKNRQELLIKFNIQEGSVYTFSGITFQGNKVFSTESLQSLVRQKVGDTYNETKFQESVMAVQNKYYENGYTSNQFQAQIVKDTEMKTIGYIIAIQENDRSHIENLIIKGNTKTKEEVIRREIPIESGDIFSNTKITTGLRNLYNTQFFSQIYPEISQGSESNLVDVVVDVTEQSTTVLDFGLTFSGVSDPDEFPVSVFATLKDSNLFGEGKSLSASVKLSTDEQSVSVGYGQNWLFGLPISNNLSFTYGHSTETTPRMHIEPDGTVSDSGYYMQYEQHEFNLSASLGRRWTPDFAILTLSGGISGSIIDNIYDSSLYVPYDSTVSDYSGNWEPRNSLYGTFSADGRNVNYDPSSGWFFSQRLSWYGLLPKGFLPFAKEWGENEFFLKTDTKAELYFTLFDHKFTENWGLKLILMAYSGLSMQFPLPNTTIKQSSQLYIDGMFNGRGWTIYNYDRGRGRALWNNTLELRMPVLPGLLAVDLFFDASLIKDKPEQLFTDFANPDDWYFSYGPSARFCLQQFPLRLLLVNNFKFTDDGLRSTDAYGNPTSWLKSWHFVLSFNITNR